jgi:hypothetical protein
MKMENQLQNHKLNMPNTYRVILVVILSRRRNLRWHLGKCRHCKPRLQTLKAKEKTLRVIIIYSLLRFRNISNTSMITLPISIMIRPQVHQRSLSTNLPLSLSLSLSLSFSLSLSLSLFPPFYISLYIYLILDLSLSLYPILSISISLYLSTYPHLQDSDDDEADEKQDGASSQKFPIDDTGKHQKLFEPLFEVEKETYSRFTVLQAQLIMQKIFDRFVIICMVIIYVQPGS